jgi:hypothetical protein
MKLELRKYIGTDPVINSSVSYLSIASGIGQSPNQPVLRILYWWLIRLHARTKIRTSNLKKIALFENIVTTNKLYTNPNYCSNDPHKHLDKQCIDCCLLINDIQTLDRDHAVNDDMHVAYIVASQLVHSKFLSTLDTSIISAPVICESGNILHHHLW